MTTLEDSQRQFRFRKLVRALRTGSWKNLEINKLRRPRGAADDNAGADGIGPAAPTEPKPRPS